MHSSTTGLVDDPVAALGRYLSHTGFEPEDPAAVARCAQALVAAGLDRLPLPGHGRTLERWRHLAAVAAFDLSLVKLFEGHTDALAILAELGCERLVQGGLWAVWAAEVPGQQLVLREARPITHDAPGAGHAELDPVSAMAPARIAPAASAPRHASMRLDGIKAWCSGAAGADHALVTCVDTQGARRLAAVSMAQAGVSLVDGGWHAVGMAGTGSITVRFADAAAVAVGGPGAYLERPGFWQGGAGIAACWYGAASALGETLRQAVAARGDAHRLSHLGAVDTALAGAAAVLRDGAACIDRHPHADARRIATRARMAVETAADSVIAHTARALGAGPFCRDRQFARRMADLPVFLRQSHAESDLADLGACAAQEEQHAWRL